MENEKINVPCLICGRVFQSTVTHYEVCPYCPSNFLFSCEVCSDVGELAVTEQDICDVCRQSIKDMLVNVEESDIPRRLL